MKVVQGLFYTREHEWLKVDGDKILLGITDHAQHALGSIVYVELPESGRIVKAGDAIAVIESVKAASDVYCPVSGKVLEFNEALIDEPARINDDPFGSWMVKLELSDSVLPASLMDAKAYEEYCQSEA